jgi:hypothetical protein
VSPVLQKCFLNTTETSSKLIGNKFLAKYKFPNVTKEKVKNE